MGQSAVSTWQQSGIYACAYYNGEFHNADSVIDMTDRDNIYYDYDEEDFSRVIVTFDIMLDGKYVSGYQYYFTHPDGENPIGISLAFHDINRLPGKNYLTLYISDPDKYEAAVRKLFLENADELIRDLQKEHPDYRYRFANGVSVYGEDGYTAEYLLSLFGYRLMESETVDPEEETDYKEQYQFEAYSAEDMLAYIEDGTELPVYWQKLYVDYLRSHPSEVGYSSLAYLNDDDIPELFYNSMSSGADGAQVFTVVDGEIRELGEYGSYGVIRIYEKTGIIWASSGGTDVVRDDYYQMNDDGSVSQIESLEITDWAMEEQTKYYIGETEVTKEQWENRQKEIIPSGISETEVPRELRINELIDELMDEIQ